MKQELNKLALLNKLSSILNFYLIIITVLILITSCNLKNERLDNPSITQETNILYPTNFIDVPKPTIIPFHLDSAKSKKISPKHIPLKVQKTFKDPHAPELLKFSNVRVLDTTKFIKNKIGQNGIPNPYIYFLLRDIDKVDAKDSIITYREVVAKQPRLKNTLPFVSMISKKKYDHQYLTSEQGLPSTIVRAIGEDSKGALWMTTPKNSLIKYDGISILEYNKEEGFDVPSIIKNLIVDQEDNIWVGTRNGMVRFDGFTFKYYDKSVFDDIIMDIKVDPQKNVWIGTRKNGLLKMSSYDNTNQTEIEQYIAPHGLCSNMVADISIGKSGEIWFGSGKNCVFLLDKKTLTSIIPRNKDYNEDLILDNHNNLWIVQESKLFKYNIDSNTLMQVITPNRLFSTLSELNIDSKNRLWVNTTNKGAFVMQDSSFIWFDSAKSVDEITPSIYDHIWFSAGTGLHKLKLESFKFIPYDKLVFNDPRFLTPEIIMEEDNENNLWMAFYKKLIKYDGNNFNVYHLNPNEDIFSIKKNNKGELWIGGKNGIYKNKKDTLEFFEIENLLINTHGIDIIIDYGINGLIVSAHGDLYRLKDNQFWSYNLLKKLGVNSIKIFSYVKDKWGRIWIGSDRGLMMLNNNLLYWVNNIEEMQNIVIRSLLVDKDENLVIYSTRSSFKLIFDTEGNFEGPEKLISYTSIENLVSPYATSSILDHHGNIWLATEKGTNKLTPIRDNKHLYKVKHFSKENGFTTGIVDNLKFSNLNNENTLWWTNEKNIAKLNLDDLQEEEKEANIPTVLLKDININQQFVDFKQLNNTSYTTNLKHHDKLANYSSPVGAFNNYPEFLSVPYTMNHLTFHFSAIDWNGPQTIQYQYKVEGMDEAWSELSNTTFADYRNIPYGNHALKVKAVNQSGNWSNILEYPFTINPPWWLAPWAKIMWGIMAIGIILGLAQLRIKTIRKKIRKEESYNSKIFLLESKALRAQMNPHFIFNVINSIQSYVFLHSELEANKYINTFSKLLRMTLEMSNSDTISLDEEIKYIESYLALESIRIGNDFKSSVTIDDNIDKNNIRIPCMLFQPIIENAILHGLMPKTGEKKLTITMMLDGNYLKGIITDNGIGRLKASKIKENQTITHKSMATRIMKERFDISNTINELKLSMKTIDLIENKKPMGTKVILSIPISNIGTTRSHLHVDA